MKPLPTLITTILTLLTSLFLAIPVEIINNGVANPDPSLLKREPSDGFTFLCIWAGFLQCAEFTWSANECTEIPEKWRVVTSIVVTEGKSCVLYSGDFCDLGSSEVFSGPVKEIRDAPRRKSYKCECLDPASCQTKSEFSVKEMEDVLESARNGTLVERDDSLAKRSNGMVYFCEERSFGLCTHFEWTKKVCGEIPAYMELIRSAIIWPGTYCTLYSGPSCTGDESLPFIITVASIGPAPIAAKSWMCGCSDPEACPTSIKRDLIESIESLDSDRKIDYFKRNLEAREADSTKDIKPVPTFKPTLATLEDPTHGKEPDGFFQLCSAPVASSGCNIFLWINRYCYPVINATTPWIQSAFPSAAHQAICVLFREESCEGEAVGFTYPGVMNFEAKGVFGPWKSWGCLCGEHGNQCPPDELQTA